MFAVVTGGSGSGKSNYAESLALTVKAECRIYVATMIVWDAECEQRVARHRAMRAEKQFETLECPRCLSALRLPARRCCALLECMSNLVSNEMYREDGEIRGEEVVEHVLRGLDSLLGQTSDLIVVTNEVFSDGDGREAGTEEYCRALGEINCRMARRADLVVEVAAGWPVIWKGGSVEKSIISGFNCGYGAGII